MVTLSIRLSPEYFVACVLMEVPMKRTVYRKKTKPATEGKSGKGHRQTYSDEPGIGIMELHQKCGGGRRIIRKKGGSD